MNSDLSTFNHFVDDLISSETNLLNHELDILLMQYIFKSIDLETLKNMDIQEDLDVA